MNDLVLNHWLNESSLPGVNSVAFRNDTIVILNCYRNEERKEFAFPFCETSIDGLIKYDEDVWTEVQAFTRVQDVEAGFTYLGGEGGMGNEGFIVCLDNNQLFVWSVFFEHSNPFEKLELDDDHVYGFSTSGKIFKIRKDDPTQITIRQK